MCRWGEGTGCVLNTSSVLGSVRHFAYLFSLNFIYSVILVIESFTLVSPPRPSQLLLFLYNLLAV